MPPVAQMDDASWDKLFTTATLTDYKAEDVVRALPGTGWGRDRPVLACRGWACSEIACAAVL